MNAATPDTPRDYSWLHPHIAQKDRALVLLAENAGGHFDDERVRRLFVIVESLAVQLHAAEERQHAREERKK